MSNEISFDCKCCGHCCEGRGGIVISPKDLDRLCAYLKITPQEFEERWGEYFGAKLQVRAGEDGNCIFFKNGVGCDVHIAKPDICRAWPYFRGNLIDEVSLDFARDFCPGIPRTLSFSCFVEEGKKYLEEQGLVADNKDVSASALFIRDIITVDKP